MRMCKELRLVGRFAPALRIAALIRVLKHARSFRRYANSALGGTVWRRQAVDSLSATGQPCAMPIHSRTAFARTPRRFRVRPNEPRTSVRADAPRPIRHYSQPARLHAETPPLQIADLLPLSNHDLPTSLADRATHRMKRVVALGAVVIFGTCLTVSAQTSEPDAAKRNREQDLAKRLLGGSPDEDDVMDRILNRMTEAEDALLGDFNSGEFTQAAQKKAIEELESAIRDAVRRGSSGDGQPQSGDKRKRKEAASTDAKSARSPGGRGGEGGESAKPTSADANAPRKRPQGPVREWRRGWGNLPPRDREEMTQGADEQSMAAFREWIEQYYRALADETGDQ